MKEHGGAARVADGKGRNRDNGGGAGLTDWSEDSSLTAGNKERKRDILSRRKGGDRRWENWKRGMILREDLSG